MADPVPFTAKEKLRECERELACRRSNYPRLISQGKLRSDLAARQIQIMEAIREDYRAQVGDGPLFTDGGNK